MIELFNSLMDGVKDFLVSVLPGSPFREFITSLHGVESTWLGWLNWIIPVKPILRFLVVWLAAISAFYIYSIIMRWVKMLGD